MKTTLRTATLAFAATMALNAQQNVLLIIADDIGVDYVGAYREGANPPPTPNIDALAKGGVLFRNAYANPVCSATRATILTGRYGFRTGVGTVVEGSGPPSSREVFLPEVLDRASYEHAFLGKWHLGTGSAGPNGQGFQFSSGPNANILNYALWRKTTNGLFQAWSSKYPATDKIDDAITWIQGRKGPWFCVLSFNLAHTPIHAAPSHLHTQDLRNKDPNKDPIPFFKAMVQAMDMEIGRLLKTLGEPMRENTCIVFVGDNGTYRRVIEPPFDPSHGKTTIYDAGTRVPLIVSGPIVRKTGREEDALVNTTDLFATVAEMAGIDARSVVPANVALDSVSIVPYLKTADHRHLREFVYCEQFGPGIVNDSDSIRDPQFKLLRRNELSVEEMFDLSADPFEKRNLLLGTLSQKQRAAYRKLAIRRAQLKGKPLWMPYGAGCPASNPPRFAVVGNSTPKVGATLHTRFDNLNPLAAFVFAVFGFSDTRWGPFSLPIDLGPLGMPGCDLHTSVFSIFALPIVNRRADWSIPIPADTELLGLTLHQQGFVLVDFTTQQAEMTNAGSAIFGG